MNKNIGISIHFKRNNLLLFYIAFLIPLFIIQPRQAVAFALEFLDDVNFPAHFEFAGTRFNGLSGITYDASLKTYYIISDDRARFNHVRYYSARISALSELKVEPVEVVFLKNDVNEFFPRSTVDFEGIVILGNDNLLISSEGNRKRNISPSLNEFTRKGSFVRSWPVPHDFLGNEDVDKGIRPNLGFESLAITPDKKFIFTANEQALYQDGGPADVDLETAVRIIKYDEQSKILAQFGYLVGSIPNPTSRDAIRGDRGLVELLALDETNLLALERSYVKTLNITFIHLYHVDLSQASDISQIPSLAKVPETIDFAKKKLVMDFDQIIPFLHEDHRALDNLEGMCLGPRLEDGSRLIVFVSDGNFSRDQRSQFLMFRFHLGQ